MRDASPQPTMHTERLVLRPFVLTDAPTVRALCSPFEIADTTLTIPHPYPPGAAESWIGSHGAAWAEGIGVTLAVTHRADGAVIGAIGLSVAPEHARGELGYWITVPQWGKGYCTEAGRALLAFAFDELGLHRVEARHFVRNPASGRVMQKLGMQFEGIQRGAMKRWDAYEDVAMYGILNDDRG
jgi:ribosomal-protein-alanine N-acetyltransferase